MHMFANVGEGQKMTMAQISTKSGLAWSSARNVLKKRPDLFAEDQGGMWHLVVDMEQKCHAT
jgi:hypothetical protein